MEGHAFTHLEVHSHFTLLGGTAPAAALAARAAQEGMSHLPLTDHHALYGAVAFARACKQHGVTPITGMTVTVTPPEEVVSGGSQGRWVLLAKDGAGYRNLCRLSSWLQGDRERQARLQQGLPWSLVADHREGLICIEAGRRGLLCQLLRSGEKGEAVRYLSRLGGLWHEEVWLGLEIQGSDDAPLAKEAVQLAGRFGLRGVALQPVYCLEPEERTALRLLQAIDANCALDELSESGGWHGDDGDVALHWLQKEEMAARFAALPEALMETAQVVARCGDALPDGAPIWPALKLPQELAPAEALAQMAQEGLQSRYGATPEPAAARRLEEELQIINRHGFAPLFLVVADIVRFARAEKIPVSTRGSVANSLVAYCLGITTVDPLQHNLLFARFLNPARRNPPDIDLDFCSRERDRVLDYVRRTYGEEQVALVSTMNRLQPRSALRETAKAYGYDEEAIKQLLRRLPRGPWRQVQLEGDDLMEELPEKDRQVVEAARSIVGQPHHLALHPGGTVIAPGPLSDFAPLQWTPKGFKATQYTHEDVEAIGLPKLDLLGIRALTVLADAVRLVNKHVQATFELEAIRDGDALTGDCLAKGETVGVFQCESEGAQRTLRQLKAARVQDLAVANAFFKPGPASGGMAQAFIRRYRGEEPVSLLHPALAEILAGTQGILLFQEQVLRVAREIAGLSWAQADQLRRGMSKMRPQAMTVLQEQFVTGCRRGAPQGPSMNEQQALRLWEQVLAFSGYGFNQGHATAYADVSYRSAYLKVHFPAAFLCARLANGGGFYPPAVYIAEAQRLGIAVRAPHVNHSGRRFTLSYEAGAPALWMGLGQVRSLRRRSAAAIVAGAPFHDLSDLLARVPLRAAEVENLIKCGALDGFAAHRKALLAEANVAQRAASPHQMQFAFAAPPVAQPESRAERMAWEMQLLGQPLTVHPLELATIRATVTPLQALGRSENVRTRVAGVRLPGRSGGPSFLLSDGTGWVMARTAGDGLPAAWKPLLLEGAWQRDQWGGGWFQATNVRLLAPKR